MSNEKLPTLEEFYKNLDGLNKRRYDAIKAYFRLVACGKISIIGGEQNTLLSGQVVSIVLNEYEKSRGK